jgi:preprotein translocase subunit SecF
MIRWMKYRFVYLIISMTFIGIGIFSLISWGLNLGVDFTGGSILEYRIQGKYELTQIENVFGKNGFSVSSAQKTGENTYIFKTIPVTQEQKDQLKTQIEKDLNLKISELRYESVGPAIGPELIRKTVVAVLLSASLILLWVAYQFKSFKFGISAVLAMFHDSLVLIGMFSLLGHLYGAEIDFMFVTAFLTILSFSVHDTIVVYDRIRETHKKLGGDITDLANAALTQTIVRSFNNSMTIIFMLLALMLLGGTTIKWFAVALLIGTISGTYSSAFVAVPILVTWDEIQKKLKSH